MSPDELPPHDGTDPEDLSPDEDETSGDFDPPDDDHGGVKERLQRVLADAGVAARRVCEQLIRDGRVRVNGQIVTDLPIFVDPEHDAIDVDGKPIKKPGRRLYIMVNKPARVLGTTVDEPGYNRPTVLDLVKHPASTRLFPVGRLDFEAAGLMILTNDGQLAHRLTHPSFGVTKTYHVKIKGRIDPAFTDDLALKIQAMDDRGDFDPEARFQDPDAPTPRPRRAPGPKIRRRTTKPTIRQIESDGPNSVLEITLLEARHRQLEEALRILGTPVKKLERVAIGGLRLKGVAVGEWRELTRAEISTLKTKRAGADRLAKVGQRRGGQTKRAPMGPGRPGHINPPGAGDARVFGTGSGGRVQRRDRFSSPSRSGQSRNGPSRGDRRGPARGPNRRGPNRGGRNRGGQG